jgi:hypothetical protein
MVRTFMVSTISLAGAGDNNSGVGECDRFGRPAGAVIAYCAQGAGVPLFWTQIQLQDPLQHVFAESFIPP